MSAQKIDIYGANGGDLPAIPDSAYVNSISQRNYLALIVANLAALFGVTRLAKVVAAALFTRPADTTAYASGDLVANSTTAGSVVPITLALARTNGGTVRVRRVRLKKSAASVTNAAFRVHLFTSSPTVTNGDNGVFTPAAEAGYVGALDITSMVGFTAGALGVGAPIVGQEITAQAAAGSKNLYALIEARGAYTPASAETFTLTAEVEQA